MIDLEARFRSKCDFLTVYIREAHPVRGWFPIDQPHVVKQAETVQERHASAKVYFDKVELTGQLAVDSIENEAASLFDAMPDRIYTIREGRVIYKQDQGPFGYKPKELADFLQKIVYE